jgi:hypothetical protein
LLQQFDSAPERQAETQEYEVWMCSGGELQRIIGLNSLHDNVVLTFQRLGEDLTQRGVVIDNQNRSRQVPHR